MTMSAHTVCLYIQHSSVLSYLHRHVILLSVLGYYGNKTVQTYLGQQAIDEIGLEILTLEQALEVANNTK